MREGRKRRVFYACPGCLWCVYCVCILCIHVYPGKKWLVWTSKSVKSSNLCVKKRKKREFSLLSWVFMVCILCIHVYPENIGCRERGGWKFFLKIKKNEKIENEKLEIERGGWWTEDWSKGTNRAKVGELRHSFLASTIANECVICV